MRSALAVFLAALLLASLGMTMKVASADMPGAVQQLLGSQFTGAYHDDNAGLDITLPAGWNGTKLMNIAVAGPGLSLGQSSSKPHALMVIMPLETLWLKNVTASRAHSFGSEVSSVQDQKCQSGLYEYITVNSMSAVHVVQECQTPSGNITKFNVYAFASTHKAIVIGFFADSAATYNTYNDAFEQSVQTVKIANNVDFKTEWVATMGMKSESHSIVAAGKPADVTVDSSSTVSNFAFDEHSRKISFTVTGQEGTEGVTEVSVGKVLQAPYTVSIDGQPIDNFTVVDDKNNGDVNVQIDYHHSTHDIVITGASVVPEFPVTPFIFIAMIIGSLAIASRTRLIGRISGV